MGHVKRKVQGADDCNWVVRRPIYWGSETHGPQHVRVKYVAHAGVGPNLQNKKSRNRLEERGVQWKSIPGKVTVGLGILRDIAYSVGV